MLLRTKNIEETKMIENYINLTQLDLIFGIWVFAAASFLYIFISPNDRDWET